MNDTRRLIGAFVIAIALFFFWPGIVGQWRQIGALSAALTERQKIYDDRKAILDAVPTAYTEYQQELSGDKAARFAALVPVRKSTAEVLSAMQAIAQSTGVQLGNVAFSTPQEQGASSEEGGVSAGAQSLDITLALTGPYAGMRQFLIGLENYIRILRVNSVIMGAAENSSDLQFTIKSTAYFLR